MRFYGPAVLASAFMALGGCSIYPLPQDSSGKETQYIVANLRCQARRAVRQAAADYLLRADDRTITSKLTTYQLAAALEDEQYDLPQINIKDFKDNVVQKAFTYYATTIVTYEFTLKMTEENKQGGSIELARKFLRRADTIGIGLTDDRTRDNSRIFTLSDTFFNLATGIKASYCNRRPEIEFIYPITGRLPVEDLINSYININMWGRLDEKDKASFEGTAKGPATRQMADTIMFTTKISAVNNPTVMYNPAGYGFVTSALTFTNENTRTDLHQVIITLTTTDHNSKDVSDKSSAKLRPDDLRKSGLDAINSVRSKNLQDNISSIARSLSQSPLFGL